VKTIVIANSIHINRSIKNLCLTFILLLLAKVGTCQQLLDSANKYRTLNPDKAMAFAKSALSQTEEKEQQAKSLIMLGILNYDISSYDSSLLYLQKALAISESLQDSVGISEAFDNMGVAKEYLGQYQESLEFYKKAYEIRKRLGLQEKMALSLNSIGNIYVFLNNYPRALELYIESLKISEKLGNQNIIANTNNNIGMVYDYTGDLDKAFEYYDLARKDYEKLGDIRGLAGTLNNIGLIYKNKNQPEKSIPNYQQSLKLFEKMKSAYGVAVLQNNLGVAYGLMNNYPLALQYHTQSLATNTKIGNSDGIANSNNSLGDIYLKMNRFAQAESYYKKGLATAADIKSNDRLAESYQGLAKAKEGLKDYKQALLYTQKAQVLRDSLYSVEKSQKLYEMEQKYESALKENQIALLNSETTRQKLEIDQKNNLINQRNIQLGLTLASVILLALAIYLFYSRISYQQKARLKLAQIEQEQAVTNSLYEQRMNIAKDMHDEIGSGLSHIAMLSELIIHQDQVEPKVKAEVGIISNTSRQLVESMSEIVWAINPQNETLENLAAYLREQTNKYFEPFDIDYNISITDELPEVKLSNLQRRNLFLVTKETLNNALKHASASAISLSLEIRGKKLIFKISDNGKGFEKEKIRKSANGLKNMKGRMAEIGGSFEIDSQPSGTQVTYSMPLLV